MGTTGAVLKKKVRGGLGDLTGSGAAITCETEGMLTTHRLMRSDRSHRCFRQPVNLALNSETLMIMLTVLLRGAKLMAGWFGQKSLVEVVGTAHTKALLEN